MSQLFDDLKVRRTKGNTDVGEGDLDLFTFASRRLQSETPAEETPPTVNNETAATEMIPEETALPTPPEPPTGDSAREEPVRHAPPEMRTVLSKARLSVFAHVPSGTRFKQLPHESGQRYKIIAVLATIGLVVGVTMTTRHCHRTTTVANPPTVAQQPPAKPDVPAKKVVARVVSATATKPRVETATVLLRRETKPPEIKPPTPMAPATPSARHALDIRDPGLIVQRSGNETLLTFKSGIFSSKADLTIDAKRQLQEISTQLKNDRIVSVRVTGFTDNQPVRAGAGVLSNADLSRLRAVTVVNQLRAASSLPLSMFTAEAPGRNTAAPYPNDTPQNRARNRTVLIRVITR